MTVVAFASVKGSPGVTTLACLVGALWTGRRPVVVEADADGGDLAARFGLSSRRGWTSLVNAARRDGAGTSIGSHLQQLPGGLDVLVAPASSDWRHGDPPAHQLALETDECREEGLDLLVDLGRLHPNGVVTAWLARADRIVLVTKGDTASLAQLRDRVGCAFDAIGDRAVLAVVDSAHGEHEIEQFTGIERIVTVPFDPPTAAIASGARSGRRRLSRSALIQSVSRLASGLCGVAMPVDADLVEVAAGGPEDYGEPSARPSVARAAG